MKVLSIKNYALYQHYKDRRPPWVKLHASVLDDYSFSCLQDASKAHLMLLWLLASQCDNKIPYDLAWISRKIGAAGPIDLEELIALGFIEVSDDASKLIAPRKQSAMLETERETEAEREGETKKKHPTRGSLRVADEPRFNLGPYLDAHRQHFPGSDPPAGRFGKTFKRLERKHGGGETLRRWRNCLAQKGTFATPEELALHWSAYDLDAPADSLEARAAALVREDEAREAENARWLERRRAVP